MPRSGKQVAKFVTLPGSQYTGLYELQETRYTVPQPNEPTNLNCPCCNQRLAPVFDIQQLGFWQDHYTTYFLCKPCLKVIVFIYDLSRIEAKTRRGRRVLKPRETRLES